MTTATTSAVVGDHWSNAVGLEDLRNLAFASSSTKGDTGNHALTYTFAGETENEAVVLRSDAGFTAAGGGAYTGTINGMDLLDMSVTGLSYNISSFLATVRDTDVDALNSVLWGDNDTINGGASYDNILGFGGNDTIHGNAGSDTISGGSGADKLYGDDGQDLISGGSGNDKLFGGASADALSGGAGADVLNGGTGGDRMVGGSGADVFTFSTYGDIAPLDLGNLFASDVISDFFKSDADKIDLSALDANLKLAGDQAFTFIGTTAFHANTPGEVRVAQISGNAWQVQLSNDNDTGVERAFVVNVFGGNLAAGDFVL